MNQTSLTAFGPGFVFKPRRGILENFYTDDDIKNDLTLPQIRLFDYSLSEIDPENEKFTFLLICKDYYKLQGQDIKGGKNKAKLIEDLEYFRTNPTPIMVLDDENDTYCRIYTSWFKEVKEYGKRADGTVIGYHVTVDKDIAKAMLKDPDQLLYPYVYAPRLQTKYGYFGWLFFHSLQNFDHTFTLTLEELAGHIKAVNRLGDNYKWADFRRQVVESLVKDINDNSLDMEVFWTPVETINEETGKKRVTDISFTVHRIIDPVNVHEICESDNLDFDKLDHIKQQVNFMQLCNLLEDRSKAETAVRIIYAAYEALSREDTSFAAKFKMTNEQMRNELNELTMEQVQRGVEKAYQKKSRLNFIEIYILQCILNAKLDGEDEAYPLPPPPVTINDEPSLLEEHNIIVTTEKTIPEKTKKVKANRTSTKKAEATLYVHSLIPPTKLKDLLMRADTHASNKVEKALISLGLAEEPPSMTEEDLDMMEQCINDFYSTLAYVFSARCLEFQCGACKSGGHIVRNTEAVPRDKYRNCLEKYADIYFAKAIITKYINNFDNLHNPDNEKSRINYLITMIWNEIWLREKEALED